MNRLSRRLSLSLFLSLSRRGINSQSIKAGRDFHRDISIRRNYAGGPTISTVTETIPHKGKRERRKKEREIDTEA